MHYLKDSQKEKTDPLGPHLDTVTSQTKTGNKIYYFTQKTPVKSYTLQRVSGLLLITVTH